MSAPVVVLASASPGRLAVLRNAGVEPVVLVPSVDEDAVRVAHADASHSDIMIALASAKAEAVVRDQRDHPALHDAVVIGGDSMLLIDGELQGKPHTREETLRRWTGQIGRTGELITGHAVLRVRGGKTVGSATGTASATVTMGHPSAKELAAYIDSGEPLEVAGAFTIDGLGGWFVDRIDGDPSCVVGLALPLVRRLLGELGVTVTDLWNRQPTQ
ncbi:MAG: septum formation inhibitor Maf [Actinobacteria bacterium 69-20]|nr:septum formation inhibitor Maf [Actinomycetota bacterium]OJV24061.1 MAG: septum formation inhibitor Maf [Actinobacteria bacterium 69-20]